MENTSKSRAQVSPGQDSDNHPRQCLRKEPVEGRCMPRDVRYDSRQYKSDHILNKTKAEPGSVAGVCQNSIFCCSEKCVQNASYSRSIHVPNYHGLSTQIYRLCPRRPKTAVQKPSRRVRTCCGRCSQRCRCPVDGNARSDDRRFLPKRLRFALLRRLPHSNRLGLRFYFRQFSTLRLPTVSIGS